MNNIKLRAWDKENKVMINGFAIDAQGNILFTKKRSPDGKYRYSDCSSQGYDNDRFIIMLSTGLHDKKGEEIWEGDVINDNDKKRVVIFENGAFYAPLIKKDCHIGDNKILLSFFFMANGELYKHYEIKRIGNIYEDENLLK